MLGRKNFYGSRSIDGTDLAAMMYTIIESCKKFELDPKTYILETLKSSAAKKKFQPLTNLLLNYEVNNLPKVRVTDIWGAVFILIDIGSFIAWFDEIYGD